MKRDENGKRVQTLKESLARYMDPAAFKEGVADAVRFTCPTVAKASGKVVKDRRDIATKRAAAAIRFFRMPENRERLDRYTAALNEPAS